MRDASGVNPYLKQLGFMTVMLEIICKNGDVDEVYFQGPDLGEEEVNFLETLEYGVLEWPDVFSKVRASTFLFPPGVWHSDIAEALRFSNPALYIGDSIDQIIQSLTFYMRLFDNLVPPTLRRYRNALSRETIITSHSDSLTIHWLKSAAEVPKLSKPGKISKRKHNSTLRKRNA